jgi:hypothetical protein
MCRWLAYSGSPILMKEVLYGGTNSLVDQSLPEFEELLDAGRFAIERI